MLSVQLANGKRNFGMGCLVGSDVVLTCAHIIMSAQEVHFLSFSPTKQRCCFKAKSWKALPLFEEKLEERDDLALVFLEGRADLKVNSMPINFPKLPAERSIWNNLSFHLYGYTVANGTFQQPKWQLTLEYAKEGQALSLQFTDGSPAII